MKIAKIKVGQLIAWVIYLLMFALVLMEPNQLMSITEVNDGPGAAVDGIDGVDWFCSNLRIIHIS